jgi:hypothetical protein
MLKEAKAKTLKEAGSCQGVLVGVLLLLPAALSS